MSLDTRNKQRGFISDEIDAIYESFPFLGFFAPKREHSNVQVRKLEPELLDEGVKEVHAYDSEVGEFGEECNMLLLDKTGAVVSKTQRVIPGEKWLFGRRRSWISKTSLRSELHEIGAEEAKKVSYIVVVRPRSRYDASESWPTVILFKLPKGFGNVYEWYRSIVDGAKRAITNS